MLSSSIMSGPPHHLENSPCRDYLHPDGVNLCEVIYLRFVSFCSM